MGIEDTLSHRRAVGVLVRLNTTDDTSLSGLASLFDAQDGSRGAMLSAGASKGRRKDAEPAPPMLVFKRLGLAYGAVPAMGWRPCAATRPRTTADRQCAGQSASQLLQGIAEPVRRLRRGTE